MTFACPKCRSLDWKAVEQFSCLTPCRLITEDGGLVEVEFDQRAELARDAATSITVAYMCASEGCGYTIHPEQLQQEVRDHG